MNRPAFHAAFRESSPTWHVLYFAFVPSDGCSAVFHAQALLSRPRRQPTGRFWQARYRVPSISFAQRDRDPDAVRPIPAHVANQGSPVDVRGAGHDLLFCHRRLRQASHGLLCEAAFAYQLRPRPF